MDHLLTRDSGLLLLGYSVGSSQDSVVTLIRLQSNLFEQLEATLLEFLSLRSKHSFCRSSRINAASLDGNDTVTTVLQEVRGVERNDTRLIRLCNISKDAVDHGNKLTILEGVTSIFDDGNDVRTLLCKSKEITTTAR